MPSKKVRGVATPRSLFDPEILTFALKGSLRKLDPRIQIKNPVMFVVYLGAFVTLISSLVTPSTFSWLVTVWLVFTVLFANFAEAMAEGRGKAQADALKRTKTDTNARLLADDNTEHIVSASSLKVGDLVVCEAGDIIPSDGEVVEGIASVDESAITGESAPVIRESGGDRSAVTGGTKVLSDRIVIRVTAAQGDTFLDHMISLVEGANRQKTPNEVALSILLIALTVIFLPVVGSLEYFAHFARGTVPVVPLIALLVCLIPTTIGALLSAIGIAGMDRLVQKNVLAMSGKAVEAAGDVSTLLLDKTGTITFGNRMASTFVPLNGHSEIEVAENARLASIADETPEGRSIVVLAKEKFNLRSFASEEGMTFVPFSATTRMSGVDTTQTKIRKGAVDAISTWAKDLEKPIPPDLGTIASEMARAGSTPLAVARDGEILGVIELKDVVKPGIRERFEDLRKLGIRTVMITGDNPLTASAIAAEAGVDDFLAEATPERKLELIKQEQAGGKLVAMTGDGTNDAPALAQADVGVAMNSGTVAAKEAGNMVDLDSSPTKLIDIVEVGKQLLITRGALTTFSIANDLAKYFAIIPAIFAGIYPQLEALNIMHLHSPKSAIMSAVIFNAIIIIALIPLALRGVRFKPTSAKQIIRRNVLIYGVGGVIIPFIGIKLIDILLTVTRLY
jgi:K+-transporting ATPase ATPase B chain